MNLNRITSKVRKRKVISFIAQVVPANGLSYLLDSISPSTIGSTVTLDFDSKVQRIFTLGTLSSNKTIALSNAGSALVFLIRLNCTGAVSLTFPSTFRGLTAETRWTNVVRILLLTGATATPFEISCTWDGTFWALKATTDYNLT